MGSTWLVVELQQAALPLTRFTAEHDGCTIDLITEPPQDVDGQRVHPAIFMVKCAPATAVERLLTRLDSIYGPVRVLRREPGAEAWAGRLQIPEAAMDDPSLQALAKLRERLGVGWVHLEEGVLHVRARVKEGSDPARLAREIQGYLDARGIEAQVTVQEMPEHDFGVWRDLVEYSVGLAP